MEQTQTKQESRKESMVDTLGAVTYPLIAGAMLDYASGLRGWGVVASRVYATGINLPTGALYGKWRNFMHKKTAKLKNNLTLDKLLKKGITFSTVSLAQLTGSPYQAYPEIVDYITQNSKIQNSFTDLLAFNTFQVPLYASVVAVGSLISEGKVDWDKVKHGTEYLAMISPFIGPTLGWYIDGLRKVFRLRSAPEKAGSSIRYKLNRNLEG